MSTVSVGQRGLAVAAVIAVLAAGSSLYLIGPGQPPVGARPTVAPTESPLGLTWTRASLNRDWPVPIRAEPVGDAVVRHVASDLGHMDPRSDIGRPGLAWLDIEKVALSGGLPAHDGTRSDLDRRDRPRGRRPAADPGSQRAMDRLRPCARHERRRRTECEARDRQHARDPAGPPRMALGTSDGPNHVGARTAIRPGRREVRRYLVPGRADAPGGVDEHLARFSVGLRKDEPVFRVYAWASSIENGRVVATDYAPNLGCLERGADTTP